MYEWITRFFSSVFLDSYFILCQILVHNTNVSEQSATATFLKIFFFILCFSFDSAENEELTSLLIRELRGLNDGEKFKESEIRGQFL